MDLNKMSVVELKALAFDQLKISEQTQVNLRAINQEIAKKEKEPKKEEKK